MATLVPPAAAPAATKSDEDGIAPVLAANCSRSCDY
jgi:hypothetical protein